MIYCGIDLDDRLKKAIAYAEGESIIVLSVTKKQIMVGFRLGIWEELVAGNLAYVDIATFNMFRLYEASAISVLAVFPASFSLRIDAVKSMEYKQKSYKFNETIRDAIQASIACAGADIDSTLFL